MVGIAPAVALIKGPAKLAVRRRKGRKREVGIRAPAPVLALPNQRWSLGFVHDQMVTGRRSRVLNIVDDLPACRDGGELKRDTLAMAMRPRSSACCAVLRTSYQPSNF